MTIQDVTDIIQTIAVIAVALPAFRGLSTWRVQLIGRRKIELAEEALTLAYELQGVIEWARHPAIFGGEGADREGRENEPEGQQGANDAIYSRITRLAEHEALFSRLRTVRMSFRAYFGQQAQDALSSFAITRNNITSSVGMLIRLGREKQLGDDMRKKLENVVWDMSTEDEPDEIRKKIKDAVADIESVCSPILIKT